MMLCLYPLRPSCVLKSSPRDTLALMPSTLPTGNPPDTLEAILDARLQESALDQETRALVLASLKGEDAISDALTSGSGPEKTAGLVPARGPAQELFLRRVAVSGFRGIGPQSILELSAAPGLTIVTGPNGSGKSSFAEAVELALTGKLSRLASKRGDWVKGWPNVHEPSGAEIEVELAVSGSSETHRVRRTWTLGDISAQPIVDEVWAGSQLLGTVSAQHWAAALEPCRPLLSPSDLINVAEKPTTRFDTVYAALGLTALTEAESRLSAVKREYARQCEPVEQGLFELQARLAQLDDERARECLSALTNEPWDLDLVDAILARTAHEDDSKLSLLEDLAGLGVPESDRIDSAIADLREASQGVARSDNGDVQQRLTLKRLLGDALAIYSDSPPDPICPVCRQTPLDDSWRLATEDAIRQLEEETEAATSAADQLGVALANARRLLVPAPDALSGESAEVDTAAAVDAWHSWSSLPETASAFEVVSHLESAYPVIVSAIGELRIAARAQVDQADRAWQPLAANLAAWVRTARDYPKHKIFEQRLKGAEAWVKQHGKDIAEKRFRPMSDEISAVYDRLVSGGHSALLPPRVRGSKKRRTVDLIFSISGHERPVEGVMSHGEANLVALSVFLPRVKHTSSPFRFIVIDDPVAAMDGVKIEGLARVLSALGKTHQVVVFTHDLRLPAAVQLLQINADHIEVSRTNESQVVCQPAFGAVRRNLDHARQALGAKSLVASARRTTVAGFLRNAVEAQCDDIFTRERLRQGERFDDVAAFVRARHDRSTKEWLALALFGSEEAHKRVQSWLEAAVGAGDPETVNHLNSFVHDERGQLGESIELEALFTQCERLLEVLGHMGPP